MGLLKPIYILNHTQNSWGESIEGPLEFRNYSYPENPHKTNKSQLWALFRTSRRVFHKNEVQYFQKKAKPKSKLCIRTPTSQIPSPFRRIFFLTKHNNFLPIKNFFVWHRCRKCNWQNFSLQKKHKMPLNKFVSPKNENQHFPKNPSNNNFFRISYFFKVAPPASKREIKYQIIF